VRVATEVAGEKAAARCYVTKVDPGGATLSLHLSAADAGGREALRSTLLQALAQRFTEAKLGANGTDSPAFS
jgi:hypothetical protein